MTAEEFSKTVVQRKSGDVFIWDVRPFADRQAEAVEFCLRETARQIQNGGFSLARHESIAVWCDRGTCFYYSTLDCYRLLWRARFRIKIEEKQKVYPAAPS